MISGIVEIRSNRVVILTTRAMWNWRLWLRWWRWLEKGVDGSLNIFIVTGLGILGRVGWYAISGPVIWLNVINLAYF
jgi:hypothetical protein